MKDDARRRRQRDLRLDKQPEQTGDEQYPQPTKEEAAQRGEDPPDAIGAPRPPDFPEENPEWQPVPGSTLPWQGLIHEHGREHRPNREDVLPYLLIRAYAPGDRAVRPVWPPTPSWLSPDILLIDASWTGPFRADQVVMSPTAGRTYRVFVHVWNLGLLAAVGVHVQAWWVDPGFFSGSPGGPTPNFIGGAFVDLNPRTAPGAHQVVEMVPAWSIPSSLTGHECLLAAVDCPADRWNGVWDANADRHVGQRNISILGGGQALAPLLGMLGQALPMGAFLEMTLTWATAREPYRLGVPIKTGQHLLVATNRDDRLLIMPTTRLADAFGEQVPDLSKPGTAAGLFGRWLDRIGGDVEPSALDRELAKMLDAPELSAEFVLKALGVDASVTLNLAMFDREGKPGGGYSLDIAPEVPKAPEGGQR
jgi:hypothetical protein